jgi:hypothetical protein
MNDGAESGVEWIVDAFWEESNEHLLYIYMIGTYYYFTTYVMYGICMYMPLLSSNPPIIITSLSFHSQLPPFSQLTSQNSII